MKIVKFEREEGDETELFGILVSNSVGSMVEFHATSGSYTWSSPIHIRTYSMMTAAATLLKIKDLEMRAGINTPPVWHDVTIEYIEEVAARDEEAERIIAEEIIASRRTWKRLWRKKK